MGKTIGREAQANDVSVVLGPAVNIKRSPLCGRNFEYYSEDPYLAGEVAAAFINGVQSQHVGTSIKHFAANNQEYHRMSNSSEADERTLREIYFPAFETAVKKAQPYTFMCSYNQINGTFASENKWLLTDVLRNDWGFEGYVMSDWGAVNDRVKGLEAGLDLEMPGSNGTNDALIMEAVKNGTLKEEVLDQAVERILNIIYKYADHRAPKEFTMEKDHEEARRIAEESMVLLKNADQILPLKTSEKVAFVGGFAKKPRFQGGGSSHINCFKITNALEAVPADAQVIYAEGFPADKDLYDEKLASEALQAAKAADKVVIFAGLPDSFESEGYDRSHMRLPECQNRLIAEILEVQPNTVIVLHNGSPVEMPWINNVKGILEAYLGGQAGGAAVANILYGIVNPSGKLAETIPVKLADNPLAAHLKGIGLTMEGSENNPVMFELMCELPWRPEKFTKEEWLKDYLFARYGVRDEKITQAWSILADGIYNCPFGNNQQGPHESIFCGRPGLNNFQASSWSKMQNYYDPTSTEAAARLMLEVADKYKGNNNFEYDLVDIVRQSLSDRGRIVYNQTIADFKSFDKKNFAAHSQEFLNILLAQDRLLGTRSEFRVGRWIEQARNLGTTPEEKDLYEWNARVQITTWGNRVCANDGGLRDYAHKEWNGLLKDFYYKRWAAYWQTLQDVLDGKPMVELDYYAMEEPWTLAHNPYTSQPEGDCVSVAKEVFNEVFPNK